MSDSQSIPAKETEAAEAAEALAGSPADRIASAEVDASLRWPVLVLVAGSVMWLIVGTALALLAAIKLHKGDFLADCAWLTVGRIRPASANALLYGFASQAGLAVAFWLLCRLGNMRFVYQVAVFIAGKLWNIGVLVGVVAILAGASNGFEWLEMPRYAAAILFASYVVLGLCAVGTFQMRRVRELYPTQWFLFAALFWFPWLYSAANYLLVVEPVRGVFQSVVAAWFAGGFLRLWLGLIALGAIYYFLPKMTGKPLYSGPLAAFAFWSLLFFGSWAGAATLQGAPVPRWVPSVGVASILCLLVPVAGNALNWYCTSCYLEVFKKNAAARFIVFGAACYVVIGLAELALTTPAVDRITGLTLAGTAVKSLAVHGFIGSVLLGAIYYILPRVLQGQWASEKMIRVHFTLHASGVLLVFVGLLVGGLLQGTKLANPSKAFITIAKGTAPFVGLSTLGILLLLVGQVLLVINLFKLVRTFVQPTLQTICSEYCSGSVRAGVKP
jgi:cytochrome c oxidase cbb3-type subunit 1